MSSVLLLGYFSSRCLKFLPFTFTFLIYLKLFFMDIIQLGSNFILFPPFGNPVAPLTCFEYPFFPVGICSADPVIYQVFLYLQVLFLAFHSLLLANLYISMLMFCCIDYDSLNICQ